jgi:hypothetical protein
MSDSSFESILKTTFRNGLSVYLEIFPALLQASGGESVSASWIASLRSMAQSSALALSEALRSLAEVEEREEGLFDSPPPSLRQAIGEVTLSFVIIAGCVSAEQLANQPLYQAELLTLVLEDTKAQAWLAP